MQTANMNPESDRKELPSLTPAMALSIVSRQVTIFKETFKRDPVALSTEAVGVFGCTKELTAAAIQPHIKKLECIYLLTGDVPFIAGQRVFIPVDETANIEKFGTWFEGDQKSDIQFIFDYAQVEQAKNASVMPRPVAAIIFLECIDLGGHAFNGNHVIAWFTESTEEYKLKVLHDFAYLREYRYPFINPYQINVDMTLARPATEITSYNGHILTHVVVKLAKELRGTTSINELDYGSRELACTYVSPVDLVLLSKAFPELKLPVMSIYHRSVLGKSRLWLADVTHQSIDGNALTPQLFALEDEIAPGISTLAMKASVPLYRPNQRLELLADFIGRTQTGNDLYVAIPVSSLDPKYLQKMCSFGWQIVGNIYNVIPEISTK